MVKNGLRLGRVLIFPKQCLSCPSQAQILTQIVEGASFFFLSISLPTSSMSVSARKISVTTNNEQVLPEGSILVRHDLPAPRHAPCSHTCPHLLHGSSYSSSLLFLEGHVLYPWPFAMPRLCPHLAPSISFHISHTPCVFLLHVLSPFLIIVCYCPRLPIHSHSYTLHVACCT